MKLLEDKRTNKTQSYDYQDNKDSKFMLFVGRLVVKVATYAAIGIAIGAGIIWVENTYLENRCAGGSWLQEQVNHQVDRLPLSSVMHDFDVGYSQEDRDWITSKFEQYSYEDIKPKGIKSFLSKDKINQILHHDYSQEG